MEQNSVLHHIAIATCEYDKYVMFFQSIGMNEQKRSGIKPNRQFWFKQGIQIKEVSSYDSNYAVDHIALCACDSKKVVEQASQFGCLLSEIDDNWFVLSNGISIELINGEK